jgi:hypothetical protein
MNETHDVYRVKIEPAESGGYTATVTRQKPSYYVNVKTLDTVEECKDWAARHVAWLRTAQPVEVYEL